MAMSFQLGKLGFALPIVVLIMGVTTSYSEPPPEQEHPIRLDHPGMKKGETRQRVLKEKRLEDGHSEFYMDVNSVFCGEGICRVDPVRLVWNSLGYYKRFELKKGVRLEKAEGKDFTSADLKKLDQILKIVDSDLKYLAPTELLSLPQGDNAADTFTGATVILNDAHVIEGAVWTCYTLWHWIHNDVVQTIRNIHGGRLTNAELREKLSTQLEPDRLFALEQLLLRQEKSRETQAVLLSLAAESSYHLSEQMIQYAQQLPAEQSADLLSELIQAGHGPLKTQAINALSALGSNKRLSLADRFSALLPALYEYQHINQVLEQLQQEPELPPQILNRVFELLGHQEFLIARRAYWLLTKHHLDTAQQQKLTQFQLQHSSKL